ncbi:class I SAM-dependent methyltransferase [Actinoalloteichus hymeniacidonis]|uniref:Methyltransferase domain n=1 Tax=Actinoalloteichus hymeniacidonis TaxID=340345 RepID=A0AAC9HUX2_9PSEU|nr:class I SAM-dependent methyltransferase [Actinoalloteichus hymeniacidonis]AOS66064.1 Methyltransferase domain [Actinoalloteichus hymeniacidonis]MBB5905833.1 SAM-dependent methyltransferase [Actinoalloteichus hymeniacidonis]
MIATSDAVTVVQSYVRRARFARAEAITVRWPRLLRGLLRTGPHVAEIPCGTGHFVTEYAQAGATVTLVDACPEMLAAAVEHAVNAGVPAERTVLAVAYVHELEFLSEVELVVMPNAALNQLACQSSLTDMLTALRQALRPGVEVLAQVACTHPDGGVDSATFYDAARQHRVWLPDRWFDPAHAGGAALRRRRQHRDDARLRIEFDYVDPAGHSLYATTVELALFSIQQLRNAFTTAGFVHVRFLPGQGGLSEVLATTNPGAQR